MTSAMGEEMINTAAETLVRNRIALAYLVIAPLALLGAIGFFLGAKPSFPVWEPKVLTAMAAGVLLLTALLGYGTGRAVVLLSVPRTITLDKDALVGDFSRKGWGGPPLREIKVHDIRALTRTRILGLPKLVGSARPDLAEPIPDAEFFYLTEQNFNRIRQLVYDTRAGVPSS